MNSLPAHAMTRHAVTALLSGLLLWLGFLVYGSTGHDDSHINFWNVHTLLTRGELVNYNGERVEQTTSLLQDFLTAILTQLSPLHLVTHGYLVDISAALGCCLLGTRLARQVAPTLAGWMPWLILSSSSFLLWTFGGMGAPLTAFCLLAGITIWTQWLTSNSPQGTTFVQLTLITLALVLVRPEMPVVIVALSLALTLLYWRQPNQRQRCLALLALSITAAAALFIWQHLYFGSWLPIPAVAKQGGDLLPQLQRGTRYMLVGCLQNPVMPLALLIAIVSAWQLFLRWCKGKASVDNTLLTITLCCFMVYTGFVWTAGGDWMQAGRFLVPVIIPASLLVLHCLQSFNRPAIAHGIITVLVALQLAIQYPIIASTSHGMPVWVQSRITPSHTAQYSLFEQLNQEHLRDMAVIDRLAEIIPVFQQSLQRPVQLMSGQAGMVFYYTASRFYGDVHFRDLRGLVESSLTLCPLLQDIPRSPQGLFWGYREFFERLPQLEQQCGIAPPDIIYDLNDMNQKLGKTLEPYGYTLIHKENGFVLENFTALPYNRLLSPNMIFVRNELLPLLTDPAKRITNYQDLPLQSRWPMQPTTQATMPAL
ncbi:MAG TPA: hypothetical protein PK031_07415 [Pseudomonadales bacterium]|nr:hypothetical protein [Pseudomonadales bacterium]